MNQFRKPTFVAWLPFYTLLQKEIRRFLRVASQTLITPVITASLYLFIFGATLGERISVLEGFSYAQFVIPGLILMGVIIRSPSSATRGSRRCCTCTCWRRRCGSWPSA